MAYVRFSGKDGPHPYESDVYIYKHVNGNFECCGCKLNSGAPFQMQTALGMVMHVEVHIDSGDQVPSFVIPTLRGAMEKRLDTTVAELVARARAEGAKIGSWDVDVPDDLRLDMEGLYQAFEEALAKGDLKVAGAVFSEFTQAHRDKS